MGFKILIALNFLPAILKAFVKLFLLKRTQCRTINTSTIFEAIIKLLLKQFLIHDHQKPLALIKTSNNNFYFLSLIFMH